MNGFLMGTLSLCLTMKINTSSMKKMTKQGGPEVTIGPLFFDARIRLELCCLG